MEGQRRKVSCSGCGAILQSTDPSSPGYVPETVRNRKVKTLCRRCFRLRHYGASEPVTLPVGIYAERVKGSVEQAAGLLVIVDIIDFAGSVDDALLQFCKLKPFVVLINKIDLLPNIVPLREVEHWVCQWFNANGLTPVSCVGVSSIQLSKAAMKRLWKEISRLGRQIAVIGTTNVGKSSFLSAVLRLQGQEDDVPTVSTVAGTTLDVLTYHFSNYGLVIADTPGLVPEGRLSDLLCDNCQRTLVPDKPLTSKLLELSAGDSILLSRYCQIDIIQILDASQDRVLFGAFVPESVTVHRSKTEKAAALRQNEHSQLFQLPCTQCVRNLFSSKWETKILELNPGQDLAIAGLGWVTVRRTSVQVRVHVPRGVKLDKRINLVGRKEW